MLSTHPTTSYIPAQTCTHVFISQIFIVLIILCLVSYTFFGDSFLIPVSCSWAQKPHSLTEYEGWDLNSDSRTSICTLLPPSYNAYLS